MGIGSSKRNLLSESNLAASSCANNSARFEANRGTNWSTSLTDTARLANHSNFSSTASARFATTRTFGR